jgi:hypothetical protein
VIRRIATTVGVVKVTDVDDISAVATTVSGTGFKTGDAVKQLLSSKIWGRKEQAVAARSFPVPECFNLFALFFTSRGIGSRRLRLISLSTALVTIFVVILAVTA